MLGKVMKYDFLSIGKKMGTFYIGYMLVAVLTKLLDLLSASFAVLSPFVQILSVVFIMLSVAVFFYQFIVIIRRVYTSIYKNEGYLTGTLPVTKNSLLLSKVILSVVFTLFSFVVLAAGMLIVFNITGLQAMEAFFAPLLETLRISTPVLLAGTVGFTILVTLNNMLLFTAALSLGHMQDNNKMALSVVFGFVLYTIAEIINVIALVIYGLFRTDIIELLESNPEALSMDSMGGILLVAVGISAVIAVGYYFVAKIAMTRKYNLG